MKKEVSFLCSLALDDGDVFDLGAPSAVMVSTGLWALVS